MYSNVTYTNLREVDTTHALTRALTHDAHACTVDVKCRRQPSRSNRSPLNFVFVNSYSCPQRKPWKNVEKKQRKSPERKCQSQPLDSQQPRSPEFAPGCPPPRSPSPKGLIYSTRRRGRRTRRSGQSTGPRRGAEDSGAIVTATPALGALYSPDPSTLRRSPQSPAPPPPPPPSSSTTIRCFTPTKWPWSPQGLVRGLDLDTTSSTVEAMVTGLPTAESWELSITTISTTIIRGSSSSSCTPSSSSSVPVAHRLAHMEPTRRTNSSRSSREPREVTPLPASRGSPRSPERIASRQQVNDFPFIASVPLLYITESRQWYMFPHFRALCIYRFQCFYCHVVPPPIHRPFVLFR